jgi:alkylation response protein AidB-like acyl-CoA dehydrogenase
VALATLLPHLTPGLARWAEEDARRRRDSVFGILSGYRVSGRRGFASGSPHCAWLLGGCVVHDSDAPRLGPTGAPVTRHLFFPAADYTLLDTWSTGGLRGTGSHAFTVADAFVPERRALSFAGPPTQPGPLYRLRPRAPTCSKPMA